MSIDDLPQDMDSLRALLMQRTRERDEVSRERDQWKQRHDEKELDRLRLEMKWLQLLKRYYGRKADDLSKPEDLAQLVLDFAKALEALPVPQAEDAEGIADDAKPLDLREVDPRTVRKIKRGRRNLAEFDHRERSVNYTLPVGMGSGLAAFH